MEQIVFMGVRIDNVTLSEALERIAECVKRREKMYVVTPNVDHIVKLQKDRRFHEAYDRAGLVTVDGTPIIKVARFYGTPLKEKIPGPKLTEEVVRMAAERGFSVFFLGAGPGIGEQAAERMREKYPGLRVAGTYSPPLGFERSEDDREKIVRVVNEAKPDIIVAGMGTPKTEIFLMEVYRRFDASVSLSTGAAIDFFAGNVKRCPAWVNRIGFEWFYRFLMEPKRMFKRYFIDDLAFFPLIVKYRKTRRG